MNTVAELEEKLANAKKAEFKKQENEKKEYESKRDQKVAQGIATAKTLFKEMLEFKQWCHTEMDEQEKRLTEYGKIRKNSKGGFSVKNTQQNECITRMRATEPVWDERATKAVELIKDFLGDAIKKRDVDLYEILIGFLQKNKKGELEFSSVMELYKYENKYNDERWKEGLRLIKESYSNHLKGFGYEFKYRGEDGKWQNIILTFASI